MESHKPVQEYANSGSSEDLQKQVIGFSGVSQTFNDPIPSTMQPELVVEQVLMALSVGKKIRQIQNSKEQFHS